MNQSKRVVNNLPDSGESCPESLEASGLNKQSGNKGKKRKGTKRFRFSYKTILSLCLISGLSVGVGTAFANDVQPPNKFRSLEPAANVNVEEELDLPPKDPDIEKAEKVTNQKAPSDDTQNNSQKSENPSETKNSSPSTEATNTPSPSSEQKVAEVTSTKQDGEKKALTTSQPANQTTSTKPTEDNKSSGGDPAPPPPPPPNKPVTEKGGKLPDTAGRDLEGVLFGGLIAIIGTLYILLKGRKARKS